MIISILNTFIYPVLSTCSCLKGEVFRQSDV